MALALDSLGVILLVLALVFAVSARKRRFDRLNELGIERFTSYGSKVRSKSADYFLIGSSIGCGVAGSTLLAFNHLESWGWIIAGPVCLFMLYLLLGN
jgi:hypothetical protein